MIDNPTPYLIGIVFGTIIFLVIFFLPPLQSEWQKDFVCTKFEEMGWECNYPEQIKIFICNHECNNISSMIKDKLLEKHCTEQYHTPFNYRTEFIGIENNDLWMRCIHNDVFETFCHKVTKCIEKQEIWVRK